MRLLRRDVEAERLHRDQTVARRLICAKDRTQRANANLVQDPERAERGRWGERGGIVSGHSGRDEKM